MAPSRGGRRNGTNAAVSGQQPQTTRSSRQVSSGVGNVYDDMLIEAVATEPDVAGSRPLKRRKVAAQQATPDRRPQRIQAQDRRQDASNAEIRRQTAVDHALEANQRQIIDDSSEDDNSDDESDFQFEDVDLDLQEPSTSRTGYGIDDLSISIDPPNSSKTSTKKKRKPATSAEKFHRLVVHKLHLLYLLSHCMHVNGWCNDESVHKTLRVLLSKKNKGYLNPERQYSQFQRNRSFMEGLQDAVNIFNIHFTVTSPGMRRPRWLEPEQDIDDLIDDDFQSAGRKELRRAARDMEGSQDVGNQLFCALLRSVGVDARLVCSLQTLPFAIPGPPKGPAPKKPIKRTVFALPSGKNALAPEQYVNDTALASSSRLQNVPSAKRRLGISSFDRMPEPAKATPSKHSAVRRLSYPVFWVEAFNEAHQKWITVDPVVTGTVNKPSALEPPALCADSQLSYAIAFEIDGSARDVTIRYAKAFNAKTRKHRVEATTNGSAWLKRALKIFQRRRRQDRDSIEISELNQKLGREGLPSNVQDFKGHPIYALERHLKRHEVIHPRRECGKVNAGTAARPKMELVFRREDALACRSADKWYRVGREIKKGEQPLKYVPSRRSALLNEDHDDDGGDTNATTSAQTGLYAVFQTVVYTPPPVERGRVPRNAFGNLDIYVPSMVPAGGAHIRHPLAKQAAQFLNVDATDAVTGFKFKGRRGTAVIEGAVIPAAFAAAVAAVIEGMEYDKELEECRSRSFTAMRVWKRLLIGLRIAERVAAYGSADDSKAAAPSGIPDTTAKDSESFEKLVLPLSTDVEDQPLITAGMLSLVDAEMNNAATGRRRGKAKRKQDDSDSESQFADDNYDDDEQRALPPRSTRQTRNRKIRMADDENIDEAYEAGSGGGFLTEGEYDVKEPSGAHLPDSKGGFLLDGDDDDGGGFLPNDSPSTGGFLVDDALPHHRGNEGAAFADGNEITDSGGGFLVPEDDEDQVQQQDTEIPSIDDCRYEVEPSQGEAHVGHSSVSRTGANEAVEHAGGEVQAAFPTIIAKVEQTTGEGLDDEEARRPDQSAAADTPDHDNEANGGSSDKGSLLSHDPEDDDAEPDWLESD
ncbi:Rad4-domain-containing protein [Polychaeton citri CBS 116435]|uniref:Rad4-domain-containing protein n=1 Tax=Polychaeton citri CBS 116435 TaxID=1314669 RepID=A0A9P4Q3S1_9PEZI|nr:Rad4-domain-containing protein [Polychaeton citri CBS 116435]